MKYCSRCLYPENHPYGIIFNQDGLCSGCIIHEEKNNINWLYKLNKLKKISENFKKQTKKNSFNCIVPVTGGSDSYFVVHFVKNILDLKPLLVHYNSQYNTKVGIRNLANLVSKLDCDLVTFTHSPDILKKITKYTLEKYGSIYWQVLAGYTAFPVQTAVKYKIPFIIWGVNGWSEQTGMFSHHDEVEMTERCRTEHCLMGIKPEYLVNPVSKISRKDVQPFIYPYDNEISAIGIRGIYLSNYLRWDSKKQHESMIKKYNYETAVQQRTFNTYEDVHCYHSAGLHDYIKFLKYGFSKVTDHASREIRLQRMSRNKGIELVSKYSPIIPDDTNLFLDWIEIKKKNFFNIFDKFRDLNIWKKTKGGWKLKDHIKYHSKKSNIKKVKLKIREKCNFIITKPKELEKKNEKYLLMGRGYIDKFNFGAIEPHPDIK